MSVDLDVSHVQREQQQPPQRGARPEDPRDLVRLVHRARVLLHNEDSLVRCPSLAALLLIKSLSE